MKIVLTQWSTFNGNFTIEGQSTCKCKFYKDLNRSMSSNGVDVRLPKVEDQCLKKQWLSLFDE